MRYGLHILAVLNLIMALILFVLAPFAGTAIGTVKGLVIGFVCVASAVFAFVSVHMFEPPRKRGK